MNKLLIASKLPEVKETIFTTISSLAAEYNAINLGQGFPDYPMHEELTHLVSIYMNEGFNQYTHMNGYPPLREILSKKIYELYNNKVIAEKEITITPGGTYGIYTALTTILNHGDEVIVFEPAYDCYIPTIELNGAIPVLIPLQFPNYKIDWEQVRTKITSRTKMIIVNSPHNPTGSIMNKEDIHHLQNIVKDTGIFILSDEVYEHLIFDNQTHESILKYPELFQRSLVCFSFGKVFHCTGWKLGYCVAPEVIMEEFRKIHQFNAFSCNTPMQYAIAKYLETNDSYNTVGSFIQKKRDYFQTLMKETRFTPFPTYGSYFQLYSYKDITNVPDKEFAKMLIRNNGVATIPVSAFYKDGTDHQVLRFCFAKKESSLLQAVERLCNI